MDRILISYFSTPQTGKKELGHPSQVIVMKRHLKEKKNQILKAASDLRPPNKGRNPGHLKPITKKESSDYLKPIIDRILACESVTQTLFELDHDLKELFNADKVTIYAIDRTKKQLF